MLLDSVQITSTADTGFVSIRGTSVKQTYAASSSNNMPKPVKKAFVKVLNAQEHFIEDMTKHRRYKEETCLQKKIKMLKLL